MSRSDQFRTSISSSRGRRANPQPIPQFFRPVHHKLKHQTTSVEVWRLARLSFLQETLWRMSSSVCSRRLLCQVKLLTRDAVANELKCVFSLTPMPG
ncbi:hypothetical protein RRG08_044316 [Elysia crispata]|uniref:Uncharacterized protein n=1 Tax=Elysia crispata TaxID=231223 RepID=A0AAE0ZBH4_9GAST|nr:hypothetical protein RRG08_044316 [Elysia crispata]